MLELSSVVFWILTITVASFAFVFWLSRTIPTLRNINIYVAEVFVLTTSILLFANIFISDPTVNEYSKILSFVLFGSLGILYIGQLLKSQLQRNELRTINTKLKNISNQLGKASFKLNEHKQKKRDLISFLSYKIKEPLSRSHDPHNIISDLEDYIRTARIELNELRLEKEPVPVVELVNQIVGRLGNDDEKKIIFDEPTEEIYAIGDRDRLEQAFFDVIGYAKHNSKSDYLTIIPKSENNYHLCLELRHCCVDNFDLLCSPYYRSYDALENDKSLFLAKEILIRHGGDMVIQETDGVPTICVLIPTTNV